MKAEECLRCNGGCLVPRSAVDVLVLQPSGETVFDGKLPDTTSIWELQKRLSACCESCCPNKLTLLHGNKVLSSSTRLNELQPGCEVSLCLVRKPHRNLLSYVPKQEESMELKMQKCIILGEAFSGKTQFLRALAGESFCEEPSSSCGLDFRVLHIASQGEEVDRKVKMKIWSARGMDRLPDCFKNTFFDDAEGCFLVFNLAKLETFTAIRELVSHFRRAVSCARAQKCALLIGTHADVKLSRRQVSEEEAIRLASELECAYQEVSCKSRHGIEEAMQTWFDLYFDTYQEAGCPVSCESVDAPGSPGMDKTCQAPKDP